MTVARHASASLPAVAGPRGTTLAPVRLPSGVCGILHESTRVPSERVAIVCPPVFYEHQLCQRTLRALAERLAAGGVRVLRMDYRGIAK